MRLRWRGFCWQTFRRAQQLRFVIGVTKGRGRGGMFLLRAGVAFAAAAPAAALAQAAPPPAPPPPSQPPSPPAAAPRPTPGQDDIVVTAPAQQSSIDRQTYLVRDTAEARSATTLDILSRIPSVEVQADNSIRLVGAGFATILVDGRRVSDPTTYLRNLRGSQIERIEVMTNPGAQFPAQGTGGILNIITRRDFQNGLGGSANATAGRFETYYLGLSPTYQTGDWTLSGSGGYYHGSSRADFERDRFTIGPGGPVPETSEAGQERNSYRGFYANGSVSYRPTNHQTITLSGTAAHTDSTRERTSLLTAAAIPGGSADQLATGGANVNYRDLGLDYRGVSARPGETLTASAKWTHLDVVSSSLFSTDPMSGPPTLFRQAGTIGEDAGTLKADYVRPLGGVRQLSFGAQLVYTADLQTQAQSGDFPFGTGSFAASSRVRGHWIEHGAYVTFQFGLGGFTILPGLRIEGREYDRQGSTRTRGLETTHLFPSLHLERPLARWLIGDASYSRRVTYPTIPQLDAALNYSDATTAFGGNPLLRPQLTNSFEAKLRATLTHHNLDLTLLRRTTDDIWSARSDLDADGVLVSRPFNFGTQALTGGELSARGPLAKGLRYVATANVGDQRLDPDGGGPLAARHSAAYTMTGQLEYRDGRDGRRGADRVNLTLRYFGPYDNGFTRSSSYAGATATWSHAITDRLSSVLTIADLRLTPPRESISISGTSLSRDVTVNGSPRVTLSLSWSFRPPGQGPQVRPQQPAAPPIPTQP
jgi:outer membrane receptor protein involved in Fe transport